MKKVSIYKPAKSTMQSGRARQEWVIVYPRDEQTPRRPEPLMGWSSAEDTLNEVRLSFVTQEEAIEFARKNGWEYHVGIDHQRKVKPRNYTDNFRYMPPADAKDADGNKA